MKYKVLGKRIGSFNDPVTGNVINFGRLFVSYQDPDVEGMATEAVKVSPQLLTNIKVGDTVRLDRNNKGRVLAVELAS